MLDKAKEILKNLTLEEKASLCSGLDFWRTKPIERVKLNSIMVSDGPHGLRKEDDLDDNVGMKKSFPATAFPPAVNLASSWDEEVLKNVGNELGKECLDQDVSVILGPGVCIKRSPLCGRNFEYMSEDPYLAGILSRNYIEGVQQNNVGTSLKHFAVNNQEKLRMVINAVVDERALREIYLPAFEEAVKAKPWTVMCSYNRINGVYSSDNKKLLTDILRDEWGYEGIVVSDWNALNDRIEAIRAGLDLEMPSSGGVNDRAIVRAVQNGNLKEEDLDVVVLRLLEFILKADSLKQPEYVNDYVYSHGVARDAAEKSMVLLKNDDSLLPIKENSDIVLIGNLAKEFRYQGSGSSRINPYNLVTFTDALDAQKTKYDFYPAYNDLGNEKNNDWFNAAINAAKTDKPVVVCVGLTDDYECEGADRLHMTLPVVHNELIEELLKVNKNIILVLFGGSPVEMPWIKNVSTLLNAYLPGEAGGEALYNIIFGKVNPSGKLAETYPIKLEDNMVSQYFPMGPKSVEYRESIFVGYRYFDTAKKDVLFPFGYGLSYTTFEYSDLVVDGLKVSYTVKNTGKVDGAEISQLYIKDNAPCVFKAEKELKGFKKTYLKAGESCKVEITLDKRSFAFYNTRINDWSAVNGEYTIMIGASSRDIRLETKVNIDCFDKHVEVEAYKINCPSYYKMDSINRIPDDEFKSLYKGELPSNEKTKRGDFDRNVTMGEMKCCFIGKVILFFAPIVIKSQVPNADITTMMMLKQGMEEMPLRGLNGITSGLLDDEVVDGMILWANRHRLKGLGLIIHGLLKSLGKIARKDKAHAEAKAEAKAKKKALKQEKHDAKLQKKEENKK